MNTLTSTHDANNPPAVAPRPSWWTQWAGTLARIKGYWRRKPTSNRAVLVAMGYCAQFSPNTMEVLDAHGTLVQRLHVRQCTHALGQNSGTDQSMPSTHFVSYEVVLECTDKQLVLTKTDQYDQACQMFTHAERALTQCLFEFERAPVSQRRAWWKRLLRALLPWVGGGAIVIAYSLYATSGGSTTHQSAQATPPQAPDIQIPTAAAQQAILNGTPPAAWAALTDEQRQTLLRIATQTAQSVTEASGASADGKPPKPFTHLSAEQLKQVTSAFQLKFGSGKKVFYVFEDPMCPSCRQLASETAKLDSSFSHVVLPIGFQTGSRERAAAALCAPDPLAAWQDAMQARTPTTQACEDGYQKVDRNNKLFIDLGLGSTPTLVGAKGALIQGSGTLEQITAWVEKNL